MGSDETYKLRSVPIDEAVVVVGRVGPTDTQTHDVFNADLHAGIS